MLSYNEPKLIIKFFGKSVFFFQILAKIEMMLNKNLLFSGHYESTTFYFC